MELLQNLKIEMLYSPAIPFLGNFLKKTKTQTQKDTRTSVFLAMLFTIAKIWKQPKKCPSKGEWTKNVCVRVCVHTYMYTYTVEYYLVIKKNKILPLVTMWMDLEGITLHAISDQERQIPYGIT